MKSERIAKIEKISKDMLKGYVNPLAVLSLAPFDRLAVIEGFNLCSLTLLGLVSSKSGKKIHLKQLQEVDHIIRETEIFSQSHKRWCKSNTDISTLRTRIYKDIKNSDGTNMDKIFILVCTLLDAVDRVDVYSKLAQEKLKDENFKENLNKTAMKNIDYLAERFGYDMPYLRLLESFFAACKEDELDKLYADLEPEEIIKLSEDLVPEKASDEERAEAMKAIKSTLNTMYPEYGYRY